MISTNINNSTFNISRLLFVFTFAVVAVVVAVGCGCDAALVLADGEIGKYAKNGIANLVGLEKYNHSNITLVLLTVKAIQCNQWY